MTRQISDQIIIDDPFKTDPFSSNGNTDALVALRNCMNISETSELDILAIHRAGLWVIQADGYGISVTKQELAELETQTSAAAKCARKLIQRFSKMMPAPKYEGQAIASSEAGWRFFEPEWI